MILYGAEIDHCQQAMNAAFTEVLRIEGLLSPFKPDSELSRINRTAPYGPVKADPEVIALIQQALAFAHLTQGALDLTITPLMKLWSFRNQENLAAPPTAEQIQRTLRFVGYPKVIVDVDHSTVGYLSEGVEIEFGSMGKGYAIDRAVQVLKNYGISQALVSFGSSTYALGCPPGKEGWGVAIRHPRNRETAISVVTLKDCAISTSGDCEQSISLNGRRYSHILDPRNGHPVSEMRSVSVISSSTLESDAFSTAAFVMGPEEGLEFLERRFNVEGSMAKQEGDGKVQWFQTTGWMEFDPKSRSHSSLERRKFLAGLLAISGYLMLRPRRGYAIIYLTRQEALQKLIPQADSFLEEVIALTPSQREEVQELLGNRVKETSLTFWMAQKSGTPVGYAVLLDVIGKEQPITFMVGVSPEGAVLGVEVLTYRESQGSEIRSTGFMKQFVSKTLNAPLKLGRDIHSISGATLSSRSTAYAVKKALALVQVVYLRSGPRAP